MTPAERVEVVRVPDERTLGAAIEALVGSADLPCGPRDDPMDHTVVCSGSVRLRPGKAPTVFAALERAQRVLGYEPRVEVFIREEKADAYGMAMQAQAAPPRPKDDFACVTLWPRTVRLLRAVNELAYVFGHEIGHLVAGHAVHGEATGYSRALGLSFASNPAHRHLGFKTHLACEMTADRLGLLVCRDLHAAVRVEMMAATGVDSGELPTGPEEFLEQARDVVAKGRWLAGSTHPLAAVRCHVLELFARSDGYARAVGAGAGELSDAALDAEISAILDRFDPEETARAFSRDRERKPLGWDGPRGLGVAPAPARSWPTF